MSFILLESTAIKSPDIMADSIGARQCPSFETES